MKDYVAFAIALFIVIVYVLAEIAKASRARATARCRDGSLSYSANPCGTCSWHGGVATWISEPA